MLLDEMVKRSDCLPYLNSQDKSETNSTGERERPSWPVECEVERSLASVSGERSPPAAMEPPVFHPPSGMESARVGETQKNVLLEVLSYCRFLHAAVQRLEQKIDSLQSKYRTPEISEEPMVAVRGGQLSWSLAQRLGPSPQTKPLRNPARGQDAASVLPRSVGGKRSRRRRRRAHTASEQKQEAARDATEEDPRGHGVHKSNRAKRQRKQRKRLAAAGSESEEPLSIKEEENRNAQIIIKNNEVHKASSRVRDRLTPGHVVGR